MRPDEGLIALANFQAWTVKPIEQIKSWEGEYEHSILVFLAQELCRVQRRIEELEAQLRG